MTGKKLIFLVIALAIVVGIIFVSENLGEDSEQSAAFFPNLTTDNISAIEISNSSESVAIRRQADSWVVTKPNGSQKKAPTLTGPSDTAGATASAGNGTGEAYPADSASVQTALEKIASMKRDELISRNPKKQDVFEVDSARGVLVTVWSTEGKKAGSFRLGKSGPDWSSNYVRMIGSDDVYTVRGRIKGALFTEENRWRDKSVISLMPEQVTKLTLAKRDGDTIKLEQKLDSVSNPFWTVSAAQEAKADQQKVSTLLSSLANLKAADWADESLTDSAMGFTDPTLVVSSVLANGKVRTLTVGDEKSGKMYVQSDDKPQTVFLVTKTKIDELNKGLDDLEAKEKQAQTVDVN